MAALVADAYLYQAAYWSPGGPFCGGLLLTFTTPCISHHSFMVYYN